MKYANILITTCLMPVLVGCMEKKPYQGTFAQKVMENNQVKGLMSTNLRFTDSVYVPIYSNIYSRTKDLRFLLTATLSIRNSSYADTMVISAIDYFDTKGTLVKHYLGSPIYLQPMESIDYVIDEEDDSGGSGAKLILSNIESTSEKSLVGVVRSINGDEKFINRLSPPPKIF